MTDYQLRIALQDATIRATRHSPPTQEVDRKVLARVREEIDAVMRKAWDECSEEEF